MESTIGDLVARFTYMTEADALDFEKTGRLVLVAEDGFMNHPLPSGKQGEQGEPGPPGPPLRPDLVLDEATDGEALAKLQERSVGWRNAGITEQRYFAINKPTKSGFFYTRGGWVIIRDIFGGNSEISAAHFTMPVTFDEVETPPPAPTSGITLFAHEGLLKTISPTGEIRELS